MKNTHCQDARCWILLLMANSNHRGAPLGTEHLSNTHYLVFLFFFLFLYPLITIFFYICCIYKIVCLKGKPTLNNWTGCPLKSPPAEIQTNNGLSGSSPLYPSIPENRSCEWEGLDNLQEPGIGKSKVLLISIKNPLPKPDFSLLFGVTL